MQTNRKDRRLQLVYYRRLFPFIHLPWLVYARHEGYYDCQYLLSHPFQNAVQQTALGGMLS